MNTQAGGQPPFVAELPTQPPPNIAQTLGNTNNNKQPMYYSKILKPCTLNTAMHEQQEVEPIPIRPPVNQLAMVAANATTNSPTVHNQASVFLWIWDAKVESKDQSFGVCR